MIAYNSETDSKKWFLVSCIRVGVIILLEPVQWENPSVYSAPRGTPIHIQCVA